MRGCGVVRAWSVVTLAVGILSTGCADGLSFSQVCMGPAQSAPYVSLDARSFMKAHPKETLLACLDQACSDLTNGSVVWTKDVGGDLTVHTLTVTANDPGKPPVTATTTIRLRGTTVHGACGDVTSYSATAAFNASGHIVTADGP